MKTVLATAISLLISATQVLAFGGVANIEGLGLVTSFFLSFGLLIILFQLLPGFMLYSGMIKSLFSTPENKTN